MLTTKDALETANAILDMSRSEDQRLARVATFLDGTYPSAAFIPRKFRTRDAEREYAGIIARSRQPVLSLPVATLAQGLFVDGFRPRKSATDAPGWARWQANRMDAKQIGLNTGVVAFGTAYLVILPGDPVPVWRPVSARRMRAMFADALNDEWATFALEEWVEGTAKGRRRRFRLYDAEHVYELAGQVLGSQADPIIGQPFGGPSELLGEPKPHGAGVCPVVRFSGPDVDGVHLGEVQPLIPLQLQIDASTFYVEMAQQFGVHRQRYGIGLAIQTDDDGNPLAPFDAAVDRLWLAQAEKDADPGDVRLGEFGQTEIKSWLGAREEARRAVAIVSQMPPGYMLGDLINLSAEALAAAEAPAQRRTGVYKTLLGECYEQGFRLDARLSGDEFGWNDTAAQVVWRDTESRSLAQVADALGKMAQMLGIPPRALWEKVPGVTDQDLQAWEAILIEDQRRGADLAARSFGVDVADTATTP